MALFSPWGNQQFFDDNGNPATGWKIETYAAGSSTPLATFTTADESVSQSNPIIVNSLGFPTIGQIWLRSGLAYKLVLTDAAGVVKKTADNITGVTSAAAVSQWQASGLTPTFVSATSFTLVGDQTSAFHIQRRLQSTTTAGTIYSTITASAFTTLTTVTVVNDSGVLDAGLSVVNLGLLTANSPSFPGSIATASTVQAQTAAAFTTGGTATAYTLTPSPAITAYTAGQSFWATFHLTSGAAPTLAISGLATPPNLVKQSGLGTYINLHADDIPANHRSRVTLLSATQALVEFVPIQRGGNANGEFVRSPDGTLTCTARLTSSSAMNVADGNIFRTGTNTWTFPSVFIGIPVVQAMPAINANFIWGGLGSAAITASSASFAAFSPVTSAGVPIMSLTAIGRWF